MPTNLLGDVLRGERVQFQLDARRPNTFYRAFVEIHGLNSLNLLRDEIVGVLH